MRIINSLLNFLQHIENITLNISIDTFVTETNIIYFMYQFILGGGATYNFAFQFEFQSSVQCANYHFTC